jgi:hypothetical protein
LFGTLGTALGDTGSEYFEAKVRPIFATHCYSCHSSQAKPLFAGLRLDSRAAVTKGSDAGPVVSPGRPDESKLIRAVRGQLPLKMPPGGKLAEGQISDLVKWVEMGAPWPSGNEDKPLPAAFDLEQRRREHWAWQPVKSVTPPAVGDTRRPLQPVDAFLLARLEKEGLAPAEPAGRRTLLRRLTFDLTGLPPTPEELDAFEKDSSPGAWSKQVDRLLDSPRFGEHWARHWMDLIRYAESHGMEGDPDTPLAWRYRDYLIRAFNDDVPYDQLVREHLAGDLLAKPRRNEADGINESILGIANLRLVEHGFQPVDPWEDRVKFTDNQIDVFSKAFQGLTVSCARCHDHKFDAISQKDYYALFGTFAAARPTQAAIDLPERLNRHRTGLQQEKQRIQAALAAEWKRKEIKLPDDARDGLLAPWAGLKNLEGVEFQKGWRAWAEKTRAEARDRAEFNRTHFKQQWSPGGGDYAQWLHRGTGLAAAPSRPGEFAVPAAGDRAISGIYPAGVYSHLLSTKYNGVLQSPRFRIEEGYISIRMLGGNNSFAQLIIENYAVPRGGIYNLRFAPKKDEMGWMRWDTSFWKGFTGYIEFATRDDVTLDQPPAEDKKSGPAPPHDGRSWFGAQSVWFHKEKLTPKDPPAAEQYLLSGGEPHSPAELEQQYTRLLRAAIDAWSADTISEEQAAFLDYFVRQNILPASRASLAETRPLIEEYRRIEKDVPVARRAPAVMEDGGADQPLLIRGNPQNPGPPVPRRYLEALHSKPYARPARLELADAVLSPANPLTARVMVNRIWRALFGAGLVRTVDNFGKLGEPPSHPELLDWLAARFVQDGWSIKRTIRLLANSQAYRMSSDESAEARKKDPGNRLLQHMPIRRLEAEAVRDSMLSVSGQLKLEMYGPSVATYYAHDTGRTKGDKPKGPLDGNGRRSIYLEVRRNVTNPFLEAFDAPKPASTRGERDLTNVPAQSLALMNNTFVIDQAEKWARAALGQDRSLRIDSMFLRAFGRAPTPLERDRSESLLADLDTEYAAAADRELRVWRDYAHSLFNLKEFIYIR